VVRATLVWAGEPDPLDTQAGLRENADSDAEAFRELVEAWYAAHGMTEVTCRELLDGLVPEKDSDGNVKPLLEDAKALRDAVRNICRDKVERGTGLPSAATLAYRLRALKDKITNYLRLTSESERTTHKRSRYWRVVVTDRDRRGSLTS
jgi:hypothetical protein